MEWYFITAIAVFGILVICLALYIYAVAPGRRRAGMEKFKSLRYAHRGLHGEGIAENSISAFRAATDAGYAIELDVRLSKDGKLVVFHDNVLDRMTTESGRVDDKTADELSRLRLLGTEDCIPTFEEVLRLVDGKVPLLVEIKEFAGGCNTAQKTVEALKEYGGEFIIESFNPVALSYVRKNMPQVMRGFLSMDFLSEENHRGVRYSLLKNLLFNFLSRPDFIAYRYSDYKNVSLRFVRRFFGTPTLAWTVKSAEDEESAYLHGFDGVIFEQYIPK